MSEEHISEKLFNQFKEMVNETLGLAYTDNKNSELLAKLPKIQRSFHHPTIISCIRYLTSKRLTEEEVARLAKELTIGETYFFRNANAYNALEKKILPQIIEEKRRENNKKLRFWSAGCCTGEEPYSLAILLHELLPDLKDWSIELLATDINQEYLERARKGIYKPWSFRGTPKKMLEHYFEERVKKHYQLRPHILRMVRFSYLNLMQSDYRIEMVDLLLCNHVLIYFSPRHIHEVIKKFYHALHPKGRLLVSPIEVPFVEHSNLQWEKIEETIVFRKKAPNHRTSLSSTKKTSFATEPKTLLPSFCRLKTMLHLNRKTVETATIEAQNPSSYTSIKRLADENRLQEALEACQKALSQERLDYMLHYLYSIILHAMGQMPQALEAIRQCLFLEPSFVMGHFFLGMQLLQMQRSEEAHKEIQNALYLLKDYEPQALLPGSEEMSAERLRFIVEGVLKE